MFRGVVFDMDGVITDTEKLYREFQIAEGEKYGIPEALMVQVCERIAGGNKVNNKPVFESMVGRGIDYLVYREGVMRSLDDHIRAHGVELKDGVKEILMYLKEKGVKVGLATSTVRERAMGYLVQHDIKKYFDELIFGDMVEHGKPAPDIYIKACETLGTKPEETIAVEDSINGIHSAAAAGLYPVMVVDLIKPDERVMGYAKEIYDNVRMLKKII